MKPNIYECKICQEHHCEHDFPDESPNDTPSIFNTHSIILQPPPLKYGPSPRPVRNEVKTGNGEGKKDEKPLEKPSSSKAHTAEKKIENK